MGDPNDDANPVPERLQELREICKRFGVRRLELFGSAAGEHFRPDASDIDLLIELEPPLGTNYADAYFGFKEATEALFGRPVDLVTLAAVRNPYFLAGIAASRRLLYAA